MKSTVVALVTSVLSHRTLSTSLPSRIRPMEAFGSKGGGGRILVPNRKLSCLFKNISTEINSDEHSAMEIVLTVLKMLCLLNTCYHF